MATSQKENILNTYARIGELETKLAAAEADAARWHDGPPPKPYDSEWFIAQLKSGDRAVLRALPEEFAYDFKTADESYIKKAFIVRWMQFPDSQFVRFAAPQPHDGGSEGL